MTTHDIREKYLAFFERQGHTRVPSAKLVPDNDPTTLFTGSGMQPMVPYLLGQPHPAGKRITNSQKCLRVQDIDEVGDNRHTTFFEMLGNWSFGDYFKAEQLAWIFEFLTKELYLDPKRIYVSVFSGREDLSIARDKDSVKIWQKLGLANNHIVEYDAKKNWWSRAGIPEAMPIGEPGGPDSELFWDFGEDLKLHERSAFKDQPCHINCDCGRYMEIGNNVFMEYIKTETGFKHLPNKNVDFGGGLERMAAAVKDNPDIFLIDLFDKAKIVLEQLSGKLYGANPDETRAFRVILDHLRAVTFLMADGVFPANKDQGYFVRRLIRRAVRFSHSIGITDYSCQKVSEAFIQTYAEAYPELSEKKATILEELNKEESKFRKTLTAGLKMFQKYSLHKKSGDTISANEAFDLYQSYGFPIEITTELATEKGLIIDSEGFQKLFKEHQQQSRQGAEQKFKGGLADHSQKSVQYHTATHLLHQALRTVIGPHVFQKGSNITPERLRFDYSHPYKLTAEEIKAVEDIVNQKIKEDLPVSHQEMSVAAAKEKGALGLFEHKYGDQVSVYTMGDFSIEICGGPHVQRTAELGNFKIIKEEAAGAGIRRIRAILE